MSKKYYLLLKTAQAEFRAWRYTDSVSRNKLSPIIEVTRGRKNRGRGVHPDGQELSYDELRQTAGVFGFDSNLTWIAGNMAEHPGYILDLTREPGLECKEVLDLKLSLNGYENWISFYKKFYDSGHRVYPTLQVTVQDGDTEQTYVSNIRQQFQKLSALSDKIFYRASVIEDSEFFLDIVCMRDDINQYLSGGDREFFVILDHGFIRSGTASIHAIRTAGYIASLRNIIPNCQIVVIGTSFPRDVEELGDPESGSFRTEESYLYDEVLRMTNAPIGIEYGDYGSINPERFDGITRGWRPRVDYPTNSRRILYEREKRSGQGAAYSAHYKSVAKKVAAKSEFLSDNLSCWGRTMIEDAANRVVPGSAPSFWISVRMQIFIEQQIRRLGL